MSVSYFLSNGRGLVKIGSSEHIHQRIGQLQTASPEPLVCLGICDDLEAELHEKFADHRVRGEWFRLNEEIEAWIDEHARPLPPKVTVPIKTHKDMDGYIPDEELHKHFFRYRFV